VTSAPESMRRGGCRDDVEVLVPGCQVCRHCMLCAPRTMRTDRPTSCCRFWSKTSAAAW